MSAPLYVNVWQRPDTGHQWTDGLPREGHTRDFCDRVAAAIHSEPQGIRRVAVLRVTLKQGCAA